MKEQFSVPVILRARQKMDEFTQVIVNRKPIGLSYDMCTLACGHECSLMTIEGITRDKVICHECLEQWMHEQAQQEVAEP